MPAARRGKGIEHGEECKADRVGEQCLSLRLELLFSRSLDITASVFPVDADHAIFNLTFRATRGEWGSHVGAGGDESEKSARGYG